MTYLLNMHNTHRKNHLANPLIWHEMLANGAAASAARCTFALEPSRIYAENIFVSLSSNQTQAVADAMGFW
jgi:hypothetical protein